MDVPITLVLTTIGVFFACAAFSYAFFGDHILYGMSEQMYIGAITAQALLQVVGALRTQCFDLVAAGRWLLLVPLFIGALAFTRLTKYRWAARYPVAVFAGIGLGLSFGLEIQTSILGMVTQTISDLQSARPDQISSFVIAVGVISTMTYFMYSSRYSGVFHEKKSSLHYVMRLGRVFLMLAFGYRYGYVFSAECVGSITTFVTVVIRRTIFSWLTVFGIPIPG